MFPQGRGPLPPPPSPPTLSSWVGQRLSKKLSNLCLGIDPPSPTPPTPLPPPSADIHKRTKTHSHGRIYRHVHTYTHISSTGLNPLIQTVASPGFWPRLCGVVGERGGEPRLHGGNCSRREALVGSSHPRESRRGVGGHREVCVCVCVCEGLRGPSPGQRCLAAWALQGAPETGNLYMEPPLVQTLHSQLHAVYCKSSHCSSIAIHTLRHAQTIIVTFMNLHVHFFFFLPATSHQLTKPSKPHTSVC